MENEFPEMLDSSPGEPVAITQQIMLEEIRL
jgi:hypothetical protein